MANRPRTARALLGAVRVEAAGCQAEGGDWRSVVDGIRPFAQALWQSMGEGDHVLTLRRRGSAEVETIEVGRVINCTGPSRDARQLPGDLLRSLLEGEIARPGPLGLGLDVTDSGALIGGDGLQDRRIFAIGPLLKGPLWETTAVRELRCQAKELADRLLSRPQLRSVLTGHEWLIATIDGWLRGKFSMPKALTSERGNFRKARTRPR